VYVRITYPRFQYFDNNGDPGVGYYVFTIKAGTVDTLETTYSNRGLTSANTNPIVLDARGECDIYTGTDIAIGIAPPDGSISDIFWFVDYISEQQGTIIVNGDATAGTTENQYALDIVPAFTSIPDNLMVVMNPDETNTDTLAATVFTGTGINDATFSGPYVGSTSGSQFEVVIDATGPDTFTWRKDGGAWTTGVAITGNNTKQTLIEGVYVAFAQASGHTLTDAWTVEVTTPATLNLCSLGADIIYKNEATALKALSGGDIVDGVPATLVRAPGISGWVLNNPSLPVFSELPRQISRREVSDDSDLATTDAGNEVAYTGTGGHTLTLLSCAAAADMVFDFVNESNAAWILAVDGGTDVIVFPGFSSSYTSIILGPGAMKAVRLISNGVNWNIVSTAHLNGFVSLSGADTWYAPITGDIFITGGASGGAGQAGGTNKGGTAGETCVRLKFPVVKGTGYAYSVAAASATDTTFSTLTLTGGITGAASGVNGDDAAYGMGKGGIGASQTAPTGSAAGGYYNAGGASEGALGCLIVEW
jgi:hypothetical protein